MSENERIAIIARNEIVREGLLRILPERDLNVAGAFASAEELIRNDELARSIDIFVMDCGPCNDDHDCCRVIKAAFPEAKLVLLGEDISWQATADAMAAGVDGYLAREISCGPLAYSIKLVASGEKVLPSQMVPQMTATNRKASAEAWQATSSEIRLSSREIEVLRCLTRGEANKNISRALDITEATVKIHIKAIMRKLKVQNRTQAALWAMSHGVSDISETPRHAA
jgi:two-component system nitrate/nitrite response regulator NarL